MEETKGKSSAVWGDAPVAFACVTSAYHFHLARYGFYNKLHVVMKSSLFLSLASAAVFCAWAPSAGALGIDWENGGTTPMFDSLGSSLDDSFSFELGTFNSGFTPTAGNLAEWGDNWHVLDRVTAPEANGWNSGTGVFSGNMAFDAGMVSLSADADPSYSFITGNQIYLWAYNVQTLAAGNEWALVTRTADVGFAFQAWSIPDSSESINSSLLLSDADTVIYGGVNNIQGPGTYDTGAAPSSFALQTHAIPEPSSALLLSVGLLLTVRRKRA